MADIGRSEFETWMEVLRGDIKGVHDRLDELNGRTRKAEQDIAVLKDRSADSRDPTARWTAALAIVGGVIYQAAERVFGK